MKLLREITKNTYAPHLILIDESAMNDLSKNKSKKEMSKHIDHISDLLIRDGADGFDTIEGALRKTNDFLRGKNPDKFSISTKMDGCIHEDSIIKTSIGDLTVRDIIKKIEQGNHLIKVWCKDFETNQEKWSPIIDYLIKNGSKKWNKIYLEDDTILLLTEDHEVFVNNKGWIKSINLKEGDIINEIGR